MLDQKSPGVGALRFLEMLGRIFTGEMGGGIGCVSRESGNLGPMGRPGFGL